MNSKICGNMSLYGLCVLAGAAWAGVPGTGDVAAGDKAMVAPVVRPDVAQAGLHRNEALISLHRAATGIHFLPPAFSETAVRCCEPSRASR
jgi:hypothetical protein